MTGCSPHRRLTRCAAAAVLVIGVLLGAPAVAGASVQVDHPAPCAESRDAPQATAPEPRSAVHDCPTGLPQPDLLTVVLLVAAITTAGAAVGVRRRLGRGR